MKTSSFLLKNFTYYCLFKIFKTHFLFFLIKKTPTYVSYRLLKLFILPSLYKELALVFKFSHFFKYTQVVDSFSYKIFNLLKDSLVNVFFFTQAQIYCAVFTVQMIHSAHKSLISSLEGLFFNFWWLEREVSEMSGIFFKNKIDTRNLLLEYFTFFSPLNPAFPSFGFLEIYYNILIGFLIHNFISLQL